MRRTTIAPEDLAALNDHNLQQIYDRLRGAALAGIDLNADADWMKCISKQMDRIHNERIRRAQDNAARAPRAALRALNTGT